MVRRQVRDPKNTIARGDDFENSLPLPRHRFDFIENFAFCLLNSRRARGAVGLHADSASSPGYLIEQRFFAFTDGAGLVNDLAVGYIILDRFFTTNEL